MTQKKRKSESYELVKREKIDQSIHNDFDDRFTIIKRDREKGDEDSK